MGLKRSTRLTSSPEFERVYKRGMAYRGGIISVHAFPNEIGEARLGLSVSRKVGNAAERNLVKRRLREIFRSKLPDMEEAWDLVVSARPAASGSDYQKLDEEFDKALGKLRERSR